MTILRVAVEDCDIESTTGTVTWNTTAGNFRTNVRGAFTISGSTAADPPANRLRVLPFASAASEFWVSFYMKASIGGTANLNLVRLLDASNVCRLIIRTSNTTAGVKFTTRNAAASLSDLASSSGYGISSALSKFDLYVKYAGDGTGQLTLYENGVSVLAYTGANTTDGATQLQGLEFASGATFGYLSEVCVDTTDTRGKTVALINSTTAGNAQQWTGTASNVNQNALTNDAQYIYTDTANEIQQYKPAALPAGNWTVNGVVMSARAIRGDTGPQNMQFATRIATTDYFSASVQPDTAFSGKQNIQETNPATATAWIATDLADTNFQYGLKSIT